MYNTRQEAQLSPGDRAMPRVIEYFAKSLNVIRNGTIRKLGYGFYWPSTVTMAYLVLFPR